jgi:hypothetical protein
MKEVTIKNRTADRLVINPQEGLALDPGEEIRVDVEDWDPEVALWVASAAARGDLAVYQDCECGVASSGGNTHGPNHSSWCPAHTD